MTAALLVFALLFQPQNQLPLKKSVASYRMHRF